MIGRNEASCVERALRSLSLYAGEIIFVDTGSVDRTPEIARELGAKVSHVSWEDDFSKARNAALDRCTGQWILSIDCDEAVHSSVDTETFFESLSVDNTDIAYEVEIVNYLPSGCSERHTSIRLFRNIPEIRFTNPIHESVSSSIYGLAPNSRIKPAKFQLDHYGYQLADKNKEKLRRNLKTLTRWVEVAPNDPYAWYKLGLSLTAISGDRATACLFKAYELLAVRDDRESFSFWVELTTRVSKELEPISPELSTAIRNFSR